MKCSATASHAFIGVVEVAQDRFFVWFPDVPGAVAGADCVEDISERASRALRLRLVWLDQHDQPFPKARSLKQVLNDPIVRQSMRKGVDYAIPVSAEIDTEFGSVMTPVQIRMAIPEISVSH